ncbi:class I SAM-dependent methyltransferase [Mesorhizobium sp. dw_380]|uniref:class I SAM-dependent methyltransferase n=1 Tax=Mesorhizobium sp. dw_380 TaxID=2812001 RepID=UPI001BDF5787|nr:class I SAM-dependent methyltransferase [Mesorhizobium sp. dw_380]
MVTEQKDIIAREREFHNARFAQAEDPRKHLDKWYWAIRHGAMQQDALIRRLATDADLLEYGCSTGGWSLDDLHLPTVCRSLVGIDISDVAVRRAEERARELEASNTEFLAMNAEAMTFPDGSFDLVYGRGIIHHLDLVKCYTEVSRVLRPGGKALFYEPMGHNPLLNAYRSSTPGIRTEDEHPLLVSDFELARHYFAQADVRYFGLFSVASALLPSILREPAFVLGRTVDSVVLKMPYIGRFSWHALITLTKRLS